ncbi:uncharacterized protein BDZ99DRAFT_481063 [Mytilinidion resinicola]|uniref:F-box domain-containing protein n=1 Tax=Mytilinidion resinicola TaxID=574789 RepID=A0A6A6Y6Z0_9PEZI|nr:uncharacterized protein BDZ99DRAFT_481063 [Mytilinidion resinicola]KAF2804591.1 hypothetical protein BDZ99DRAFT_481063 [Mytilinidion resinicola]
MTDLESPQSGQPPLKLDGLSIEQLDAFTDNEMEEKLALTALPTEIVEKIAEHLPLCDLKQLRQACKQLETQTIHYFTRKYCTRKHVIICLTQLRFLVEQARNTKFGGKLKELIFETSDDVHMDPLQKQNLEYRLKDSLISKANHCLLTAFNNLPALSKVSMVSESMHAEKPLTCHATMILLALQHRSNSYHLKILELPVNGNFVCWDLFMKLNHWYLKGPADPPTPISTITSLKLALNGRFDGFNTAHYSNDRAAKSIQSFFSGLFALESLYLHLGDIDSPTEAANLGAVTKLIINMKWPKLQHIHFRGMAFTDGSFRRFYHTHNIRTLSLREVVFGPECFAKACGMLCNDSNLEHLKFRDLFEVGPPGLAITAASMILFPDTEGETTILVAEKGEIDDKLQEFLSVEDAATLVEF